MKYPNQSGIYQIICKVNNKVYIGSSSNIKYRFRMHKQFLRSNDKHENTLLRRAWNKYGESNFEFEVLEYCSKEELLDREQLYLDFIFFLEQLNPGNVTFNISKIANSPYGYTHTKEARKKMSAANKGRKRSFSDIKNLCKPVLQIDIDTGNIIAEFESISSAARITNTNASNICQMVRNKPRANGKLISHVGGYKWKYKDIHNGESSAA